MTVAKMKTNNSNDILQIRAVVIAFKCVIEIAVVAVVFVVVVALLISLVVSEKKIFCVYSYSNREIDD